MTCIQTKIMNRLRLNRGARRESVACNRPTASTRGHKRPLICKAADSTTSNTIYESPSSSSASPAAAEASSSPLAEPLAPVTSSPETKEETLKLWLRAGDLPRDVLLEIFSDGGIGQQVIVVGVMEGSQADKAGIVPGMKLLAISDAVRTDVTWPLGNRPSLRFVKDTVLAIAAGAGKDKEMQIEFTSRAVFTQAPRNSEVNQVSERINRRQERMDIDDQRNDSKVLGIAVGLFVGPAILILAFAYFSGYLDSMYSNSLINMA